MRFQCFTIFHYDSNSTPILIVTFLFSTGSYNNFFRMFERSGRKEVTFEASREIAKPKTMLKPRKVCYYFLVYAEIHKLFFLQIFRFNQYLNNVFRFLPVESERKTKFTLIVQILIKRSSIPHGILQRMLLQSQQRIICSYYR